MNWRLGLRLPGDDLFGTQTDDPAPGDAGALAATVRTPHPLAASTSDSATSDLITPTATVETHANSGLVINALYDSSVTRLQTSDPTLYGEYTGAVQTAVQLFESDITSNITIDIHFGWGEIGGPAPGPISTGASGESNETQFITNYATLYAAMAASLTTSAVQKTALATLPTTDPTNGASFDLATAEAEALGLTPSTSPASGWVGLDSSQLWAWTQASVTPGNDEDAVGTIEHEISETLGRFANSGTNNTYDPLDLFRYTAADGGTDEAPGSAAGARDEPFVAGYTATASSYFSYNGTTVTLPFETPADVASGSDVADWDPTINDAFSDGANGFVDAVSTTDLQLLNVLGYDLSCFASGTRIQTPSGMVAVDALAIGDEVVTHDGVIEPIVWLGSRAVDCAAHPAPERVWPIRVARHAFGPQCPAADLFLSPDHAVFIDGALVPIKLLVNGQTICQQQRNGVTYHHVELPRHAVILAEGLPVESYLEVGDRANFDLDDGVVRLFADFSGGRRGAATAVWEARGAAPLVTGGAALAAARATIRHRRDDPTALSGDSVDQAVPTANAAAA